MTEKERKLALHCLKANSDYHSEICEECIKYPCSHRIQDDVTETIIKELEQESKTDKALNLLAEWAIECGFGYDNIPEEYEKYKDDIAEMGYTEGLMYIVKMESEGKE